MLNDTIDMVMFYIKKMCIIIDIHTVSDGRGDMNMGTAGWYTYISD